MVVEANDPRPFEAISQMTAELAVRIYERYGLIWPVSGDKTAQTVEHRGRRLNDRISNRDGYCYRDPQLVVGGWLRRAPGAGQ